MARSVKRRAHQQLGRRLEEAEDNNHWLGEGISGQDSLLLDLDPYQYVGDHAVCHVLRNWIFQHQREREKPKALLVVGADQVGYQIGFLREHFEVFLWAEGYNELAEEACEEFGAELIQGPLPIELLGNLDLILTTAPGLKNRVSLVANLKQAKEALSERGLFVVLVPAMRRVNDLMLSLHEEEILLDSLQDGGVFLLPAPDICEVSPFDKLPSDEEGYMREFLKRHARFFGKAAGPLSRYLKEPEFAAELFGADARQRYSVVLGWESDSLR